MKKSSDYIKVLFSLAFALMVLSSPFLANAIQLLEQPTQEIVSVDAPEDNHEQEDSGDHSASRVEQTVLVNAHGSISSILPLAAKQIYFSHYLPLILTDFQKYVKTAFEPTLLCYIKNILLFFSAPHAP